MIISISGTPGTGKSKTARELAKLLDAYLVSVNSLIKKKKIRCGYDRKLKCRVIDTKSLQKAVDREKKQKKNKGECACGNPRRDNHRSTGKACKKQDS